MGSDRPTLNVHKWTIRNIIRQYCVQKRCDGEFGLIQLLVAELMCLVSGQSGVGSGVACFVEPFKTGDIK